MNVSTGEELELHCSLNIVIICFNYSRLYFDLLLSKTQILDTVPKRKKKKNHTLFQITKNI